MNEFSDAINTCPLLPSRIEIAEVEMDGAAIYRPKLKSDSCHCLRAWLLKRRPPLPWVLSQCDMWLGFSSGMRQQRICFQKFDKSKGNVTKFLSNLLRSVWCMTDSGQIFEVTGICTQVTVSLIFDVSVCLRVTDWGTLEFHLFSVML